MIKIAIFILFIFKRIIEIIMNIIDRIKTIILIIRGIVASSENRNNKIQAIHNNIKKNEPIKNPFAFFCVSIEDVEYFDKKMP